MKSINNISDCKSCMYRFLLFDELSDVEYSNLNLKRKEYKYSKGELIHQVGEKVTSFLYIRSGLVKLFKTDANGKEYIFSISKPGDFIYLLSIFSNTDYSYSISALEDTYVCEIELTVLKELIANNGNFALKVLNRISKISEETIENNFQINIKQVKGRVAHILIYLAQKIYHNNTFKLPITRKEIGQLISMTTENVIRTLSEFKKEGIIDIDNKTITILQFDQLLYYEKVG